MTTTSAATSTAAPATAANLTIFASMSTVTHMAIRIHRGEGLKKVRAMRKMNPMVTCSINRNNTAINRLETPVDFNGGSNPNWDCDGEFMFNSTPSTVKNYCLVLDVKHHGKFLGKRSIGQAEVPLELLLMARDGIGREISYTLFRSGKKVGKIVVSHQIWQLEDQIPSDLGERTSNTNTPAQVVGVGEDQIPPDLGGGTSSSTPTQAVGVGEYQVPPDLGGGTNSTPTQAVGAGEDQVPADLVGGTSNSNTPAQAVGVGVGVVNNRPPVEHRFRMPDGLGWVAGFASLVVNLIEYFQG